MHEKNKRLKVQCNVNRNDALDFTYNEDDYFVVDMIYCGRYGGTTIIDFANAVKLRDFLNENLSQD